MNLEQDGCISSVHWYTFFGVLKRRSIHDFLSWLEGAVALVAWQNDSILFLAVWLWGKMQGYNQTTRYVQTTTTRTAILRTLLCFSSLCVVSLCFPRTNAFPEECTSCSVGSTSKEMSFVPPKHLLITNYVCVMYLKLWSFVRSLVTFIMIILMIYASIIIFVTIYLI